jgi:hypothetical protein
MGRDKDRDRDERSWADPGVRTEWTPRYVQQMRATGKRLIVRVNSGVLFEDPDAVAVRTGKVIAVMGKSTSAINLGPGDVVEIVEQDDTGLKAMVAEYERTEAEGHGITQGVPLRDL